MLLYFTLIRLNPGLCTWFAIVANMVYGAVYGAVPRLPIEAQ